MCGSQTQRQGGYEKLHIQLGEGPSLMGRLGLPCQRQPPRGQAGRGCSQLQQGAWHSGCRGRARLVLGLPGAWQVRPLLPFPSGAPAIRLPSCPLWAASCSLSSPSSSSRLGGVHPSLVCWLSPDSPCLDRKRVTRTQPQILGATTVPQRCLVRGPSSVMAFSAWGDPAPPAGHSLSRPRDPPFEGSFHLRTSRRGLRSGSFLAYQERSRRPLGRDSSLGGEM